MGDLKTTTQKPGGATTGMTPQGDPGEHDRGDEFGAREPGTAGTDRDLDRSGTSERVTGKRFLPRGVGSLPPG